MSVQLFYRSLRDRRNGRGTALQQTGATIKYVLRSARSARLHAAWLDFVYGSPQLCAMLAADPRLLERAQHRYINRQLGQARRYAILADHYRSVMAVLPPEMCEAIHLRGRHPVGTLRLKDRSTLAIELRRPTGRGREGELCLCLADAQGELLSSMIFSIADAGRTLLLGCVQGAAAGLGREAVRELTKQSYGLRPKNLLLSLLRALACRHGIAHIRGVANAAHPFAGKAGKIKADYDSFWLECEGVMDGEGFYEVPVSDPVRDEALVMSKHRSAFRQREALRREACAMLLASLDQRGELALTG